MEIVAVAALVVFWILFGLIYLAGRRRSAPQTKTTTRRPASRIGILLQLAGYGLVFWLQRPAHAPIVPMSAAANDAVLVAATLVGVAAIAFCALAARTLGQQWSMTARLVSGHELVQRGPFAIVRHPIYLAMFGLLLEAGLVLATWPALLTAAAVFLVGTRNRIGQEEQILRRQFGSAFDEYARRVPAFLPWPR
jgi:protein-S-isoprenylcysteine O-methyltransferase Ste14